MSLIARLMPILLLFYIPLVVLAHEGNEHYGPNMMWQGYGMMILFIAVIIVICVLIFGWLTGHGIGPKTNSREDPVDILKTRFARGEIDKEEFDERLRALQNAK